MPLKKDRKENSTDGDMFSSKGRKALDFVNPGRRERREQNEMRDARLKYLERETSQLKEQRKREEYEKQRQATQERERERAIDEEAARKAWELSERRKMNSAEALKDLREMIRQRYELDNDIWSHRYVKAHNRPIIEKKMAESDRLIKEIWAIMDTWRYDPDLWNEEEWELAQEIQQRLWQGGKCLWTRKGGAPWDIS